MSNPSQQAICVELTNDSQLAQIRQLFTEYSSSLPFDLDFQNFDKELADLPGKYSPPEGCLLLAYIGSSVAGCVGLRQLENQICEMKRLFVRPEFQGSGTGRALVKEIITIGQKKGYTKMRLDTVPSMTSAIALYRKFGFVDIEPYCPNPVSGAIFMELNYTDAHRGIRS